MLAPGWYIDPMAPHMIRWWSGMRWTRFMQPAPPSGIVDPMSPPPGVSFQAAPPRFAPPPPNNPPAADAD
jgi:hypothetical protein